MVEITDKAVKILREEARFYGTTPHGALDGIPFESVAHVINLMIERVQSAPVQEEEALVVGDEAEATIGEHLERAHIAPPSTPPAANVQDIEAAYREGWQDRAEVSRFSSVDDAWLHSQALPRSKQAPAANVQDGWSAHPDQTSPMTVGPEAFFDEPVASDAEAVAAAFAERNSIPHDDGSFCADLEQTLIEFAVARSKQAPTVAVPSQDVEVEGLARVISISYGEDPNDFAPLGKVCGPNNEPLPYWEAYTEQAEAIAAYLRARAEQREAPNVVVGGEGVCETCNGTGYESLNSICRDCDDNPVNVIPADDFYADEPPDPRDATPSQTGSR